MTQELFDRPEVRAAIQEMSGEGVAQDMRAGFGGLGHPPDVPLDQGAEAGSGEAAAVFGTE
jgi:hypothetical protein